MQRWASVVHEARRSEAQTGDASGEFRCQLRTDRPQPQTPDRLAGGFAFDQARLCHAGAVQQRQRTLGIGARGVVFCLLGGLLIRAARRHDASEAGGVGDSLRELVGLGGLGRWPLIVTALGLIAYGVYELVNARYRRISVE